MIKGILDVLLLFTGRALIYLAYGSKGVEAKKKTASYKPDGMLSYLLGGAFLIWLVSLIVLINGKSSALDTKLCLYIAVGGALIYGTFVFFSRKTVQPLIQAVASKTPYECIKSLISEDILNHCDKISSNNAQLQTYLAECVNQHVLKEGYANIILDEYQRRQSFIKTQD